MAINRKILKKINNKTLKNSPERKFITDILEKENEGIGQYKRVYKKAIDEALLENKQ